MYVCVPDPCSNTADIGAWHRLENRRKRRGKIQMQSKLDLCREPQASAGRKKKKTVAKSLFKEELDPNLCSICERIGGNLIGCSNDQCPFTSQFFILECVGLEEAPEADRFCPSCRTGDNEDGATCIQEDCFPRTSNNEAGGTCIQENCSSMNHGERTV
jgi:hypothetical protein